MDEDSEDDLAGDASAEEGAQDSEPEDSSPEPAAGDADQ
jgi:hypothetical protein